MLAEDGLDPFDAASEMQKRRQQEVKEGWKESLQESGCSCILAESLDSWDFDFARRNS